MELTLYTQMLESYSHASSKSFEFVYFSYVNDLLKYRLYKVALMYYQQMRRCEMNSYQGLHHKNRLGQTHMSQSFSSIKYVLKSSSLDIQKLYH